jgi:hypothetical protein
MANFPVKWFSSSMVGATPLERLSSTGGAIGAMNERLHGNFDNIFTNGFNTRTDATAVISNGVATLTFPTAHGYLQWCVISISGANEALLNTEHRVLSSPTSTTLTIAVPGAADQTVTGTLTTRVAPIGGWTTGTGNDIYTMVSQIVNGSIKRTYTLDFRTNSFSAGELVMSGGGKRAFARNGTGFVPNAWVVIVDAQTVYFLINSTNSLLTGALNMWGEYRPILNSDIYNACIFGGGSDANDSGAATNLAVAALNNAFNGTALRFTDGTGANDTALTSQIESFYNGTTGASGAVVNALAPIYPNGNGNGLILSRRAISDAQGLRGWFRGMYQTPQVCHTAFSQFQVFDGQGYFAGRKMMALKCGQATGTTSQGVVFFDIDGPWESWS